MREKEKQKELDTNNWTLGKEIEEEVRSRFKLFKFIFSYKLQSQQH